MEVAAGGMRQNDVYEITAFLEEEEEDEEEHTLDEDTEFLLLPSFLTTASRQRCRSLRIKLRNYLGNSAQRISLRSSVGPR